MGEKNKKMIEKKKKKKRYKMSLHPLSEC